MTSLPMYEAMSFSVFSNLLFNRLILLLSGPSVPIALLYYELFLEEGKKSCAEGYMALTFITYTLLTLYYLKQHLWQRKLIFWLWYFFIYHVITKWLSSGWLWEISRRKALAIAILLCIQTAYIPPYIFI